MNITKLKIKDIKLSDYNPRNITEEQLNKLKDSIEKFGYIEPIIINKRNNIVVGGNQRLKVLKKLLGDEKEIDVVIVDLDETQEKALNIALNKISGSWNDDKLFMILEKLEKENMIEITGFEISDIMVNKNGILDEKEENIRPYKKTHILLSFNPDLFTKIEPHLNKILKINGIEYEQGSN